MYLKCLIATLILVKNIFAIIIEVMLLPFTKLSELRGGGGGRASLSKILSKQLTLTIYQQEGRLCYHITTCPLWIFRPSYGPAEY